MDRAESLILRPCSILFGFDNLCGESGFGNYRIAHKGVASHGTDAVSYTHLVQQFFRIARIYCPLVEASLGGDAEQQCEARN